MAGFHEIVEAVHCVWQWKKYTMLDVIYADDVRIIMKRMHSILRCLLHARPFKVPMTFGHKSESFLLHL